MFPFFLRKAWTSLNPRAGGARWIPYDRGALEHNPSITWIGHSTFLVRMEGVTFLTDPIFSWRASPVSFAGPQRLQPPGIPLEELPPEVFRSAMEGTIEGPAIGPPPPVQDGSS
jgi:hypothetical protein